MKQLTRAQYLREYRALFAIAWPMVIAQTAQVGTGVVDTIMAGRYSATDLAAIAIGYNIWLPVFLFYIGVMLGATTIIAQDFGAGRRQRIRDSLPQALWVALALGFIAVPVYFLAEPLLSVLGLAPNTFAKALAYLQAVTFGLPAAAVFQALRCHTQGIGIMQPFAVASVLGFLANIPLNYALIYGKWGAPELGAAGCGGATAISMWLSVALIALYILRNRALHEYMPPLRWVRPHRERIAEIWRLGLPMGSSFFLEVMVFSLISLCIASLGDIPMASHQIAYNVWELVYMFLVSFGSAFATRLGHAIGAQNDRQQRLAMRCGASVTLALGAICSLVLLVMPGTIISVYTTDPGIHKLATTLIGLAALFIIIDATQVTATFGLRAFKDTQFPFLVLCGTYWLFTLPLGYYLGMVLSDDPAQGTLSFWQAMIAGIALTAVVLVWRLRQRFQTFAPR